MPDLETRLRTDEQIYYDMLRLLDASACGDEHPLIEPPSAPGAVGMQMGLRAIPRLYNSLRTLCAVEPGEEEITEQTILIQRLSYLDTIRLVESAVRAGHSKALSLDTMRLVFQELKTLRLKYRLTGPTS